MIGISPHKPAKLATLTQRDSRALPLLSDPDHEVSQAWSFWGKKSRYVKTAIGVTRSTVVVDPNGTVELAKYIVKATGHVVSFRKALGI